MTSLNVIENKITFIRKCLTVLSEYQKVSAVELKKDFKISGVVERYLYLATQATMDLADAIIAYQKLRKPTSYRESFEILHEAGVVPQDLTENLKDMVGFRNILAHIYQSIDYQKMAKVLQNRLKDIEEFLKIAEKIR